jgi:trigger factor
LENIKVTVEEPGSVTRKITVEVPAEEVDRVFKETYREYRRQAALPGFRKGKVPMDVIEKRFREDVTEDVTRKILPDSYEQALKEADLKPIGEPKVGGLEIAEGKPMTYTAEFEILPTFEVKDYMGIEVEGQEVDVREEEVSGILEEMRAGQATVTKVEESRGLRTGDVAMIDFEGMAEGAAIPGGSAKDFPLTIGSDTFLPGFEDSVIGAEAGEEREFFLKLPEDFQEEALAGKEASFKVKVKEVLERVLPELDDAFAKDVGDHESLDALKNLLRNNIRASKEAGARGELREKLIDKLVDDNPFEAPPTMVEHRRGMMLANVERNLQMRGVSKEEIEKSRDKMYEDAAVPAERRVRATLLLEAVADKEKVTVSDDEMNNEIKRIAERNKIEPGEARRRMVENGSLENLKDILREEKTIDFLLENARVTTAGAAAAPSAEKGKEEK